MSDSASDISNALPETLHPPMANGEVLFEEPWHGRVFGMAVALHEAGVFAWSEFQASLIDAIGEWDRQTEQDKGEDGDPYQYYVHFQAALNNLLKAKGLVSEQSLHQRTEEYVARPHGHDH